MTVFQTEFAKTVGKRFYKLKNSYTELRNFQHFYKNRKKSQKLTGKWKNLTKMI